MTGLLYKDYSVSHGKWVLWGMIIFLVVFAGFRFGTVSMKDDLAFLFINEAGETVNVIDTVFAAGAGYAMLILTSFIAGCIRFVVAEDRVGKVNNYIKTFPLSPNAYVKSKFCYMGIVCYVMLSYSMILMIFCEAFCTEDYNKVIAANLQLMFLSLMVMTLVTSGIYLMLNIVLGVERAKMVGVVFMTGILFLGAYCLLFVDGEAFERVVNLQRFLDYVQTHQVAVAIFQIISPVIAILIYLACYAITCFFRNKEGSNNG